MKILYFGDIVGKVGRHGVAKVLPELKEQYQPDFVIANAENIAHGTGITPKTITELQEAGIDFFTSGNHVFDKPVGYELLDEFNPVVIRPENFPASKPGRGIREFEINGEKLLVVNLQGQVFMKDEVENPFLKANRIFLDNAPKNYDAIFVDFHAEASSEKVAMGWHLDGRASIVVGSHTHIPTADARILPDGTAHITDVGMNGSRESIIGVETKSVLDRFLEKEGKRKFEYAETGSCDINAVLVDIKDRKAKSIELIQRTVEV